MRILAIETSCDETAVALVESEGALPSVSVKVLGTALYSQAKLHAKYGGVYPNLAKREHGSNLAPLTKVALLESHLWKDAVSKIPPAMRATVEELLSREGELVFGALEIIETCAKPDIDAIAVTEGPGLEPALWVGINFAKALALAWGLPIIPVNHMEGHLLSSLMRDGKIENVSLPVLALLISGGHTELVVMKEWGSYEKVGETLDDAVGEAFDKVARLLELPYPGGPQISRLAEEARVKGITPKKKLPRPMLDSKNLDFSFSGLKTAVLYLVRDMGTLTDEDKMGIAREFEDAAAEVFIAKTRAAIEKTGAKSMVLGGGVAANLHIRSELKKFVEQECPDVTLYLPDPSITGDNAMMIGIAALLSGPDKRIDSGALSARANLSF